ncbi:MAG: M48 family metallopeptidase [Treponema sp.]|jgi:predicted Zn-dependent protease|nr:M48 family metallopeptidase [Treponema sp.]
MRKYVLFFILPAALVFFLLTCATNPLTGKSTMALVDNTGLFAMSFEQYDQFLAENKVVTGTPEARLVERVGQNIRAAAEKWLDSEGQSSHLDGYEWEYHLVESEEVNAWCMPGGKIVVYSGILPVTENEDGLATVMGHEVAHALLNHGQQRMSAGVLQELGGTAVGALFSGASEDTQALTMAAYGVGSEVFGALPFSREHESEADHYGLILMAIAGYNPEESVPFWERMSSLGGGTIEFLSTHPSDVTRVRQLRGWMAEAKKKAAEF